MCTLGQWFNTLLHADSAPLPKDFPKFRYHPDPVKNGAIVRAKTDCPACERTRHFVYRGQFDGTEEVSGICPWCIADGSAAMKYVGEYVTNVLGDKVTDSLKNDTLYHCTPSYVAHDEAIWLTHCDDFCAFIAHTGTTDLRSRGLLEQLAPDIAYYCDQFKLKPGTFLMRLNTDGPIYGYLFQCLQCRTYRLHCDR